MKSPVVSPLNIYGEENENSNFGLDEMNIDMSEYNEENSDYVELDNNDYINKEQEMMPDIA